MSKVNWSILGIEPTKDKQAITTAYRKQLKQVNPEDKPEEFKALRSAYEEALKLSEKSEPTEIHPVAQWMKRVAELYNDFPARIQPEKWEKLLKEEICEALDTRPQIEEALLNFLTQYYYIPQKVWQVFNKTFFWLDRKEELYESYAREFVDYAVVNGILYPENLPYHLFDPGLDSQECDEYRRIYYQISRSTPQEMSDFLERLNQLSEKHPYGELLTYHLMIENGDTSGVAGIQKLAESYSQDIKLQLEWAAQCLQIENWTIAEAILRHVLEIKADMAQAKHMLADCLAHQGQYEEAKKLIFQLMDAAGGDNKRIYELNQTLQQWNEHLIQQYETELQSTPENNTIKKQLAWCYLQNGQSQNALQLCQTISSEDEDPYDYHNLYAKTLYASNDYSGALTQLKLTEDILRSMKSDGSQQTESRISTLPEKLQMQGSCLIKLQRMEEATQKYEQALELAPENPEVLTHMGQLLGYVGDHQRAAEIFKKLTNVLPSSYHGYYLLSQTLYDLGQDRDAFEAINRALELEGSDLNVYLLKIRILMRNHAWEGARSIIDFLHQNGITEEINTLWLEAQLLELGENNKEKALELYRILASRIEEGEYLQEASNLYYRLLCLEAEHLDANKSEDRAKMLELANKGLSHNENDYSCLDYKAWLLKRDGKTAEALALYHRLETVPAPHCTLNQNLHSSIIKI